MHIFAIRPSDSHLRTLISKYSDEPVTQRDIGSTQDWDAELPATSTEFVKAESGSELVLKKRDKIGTGNEQFEIAVAALKRGVCFDLDWVSPVVEQPLDSGGTFSLLVRSFGLWSANFCRVIYMADEETIDGRWFTVGVGTLKRHAAIGEERLAIKWDCKTDEVFFLIDSYSQANSWLSRLFSGHLRKQQLVFASEAPRRVAKELNVAGLKLDGDQSDTLR